MTISALRAMVPGGGAVCVRVAVYSLKTITGRMGLIYTAYVYAFVVVLCADQIICICGLFGIPCRVSKRILYAGR